MSELPVFQITGCKGCYRIVTVIAIEAPVEEVWATATQTEKVGQWFAPGTIEGEGGQIQLNHADGTFGMVGEVKVLFRPHVFEFTWDAHKLSEQTIIRFDFVPTSNRVTQVTLTSYVFDEPDTAYYVLATWRFMLERLQLAVGSSAIIPDDEARVAALVEEIRGVVSKPRELS